MSFFPLVASVIERHAPALSGVYVISAKVQGLLRPIFVGRSINLKQRLKEHLLPSEPNIRLKSFIQNNQCWYRYTHIPNSDCGALESYLIRELSPVFNQIKPIIPFPKLPPKTNPLESLLKTLRR